ncbi:MAG TPA: hypothetical protein H9671_04465 [Firmicutes bacterium]|nr:hypothetical protein [Bacillota bacterium]
MEEDFATTLQNILGSSEGQQQLKNMAQMLTGSDGNIDLSKISSMLGGDEKKPVQDSPPSSPVPDLSGLDINMLVKAQQMMSAMNKDDKNTSLIRALRPHLKPERQSRADDAIKIMHLISMLPMLRESGLFGGKKEENEGRRES